jgi:hypothetical protein
VYEVKTCKDNTREVVYLWNETTLASAECVPGSYEIPSSYNGNYLVVSTLNLYYKVIYMQGLACGEVPYRSWVGVVVVVFAVVVGVLGLSFLFWLVKYQTLPIVKLSQPGHSAAYCIGGVILQCGWIAFLG